MGPVMTYDEIGKVMGVSGCRAQQICENGLRKLKRYHKRELAHIRELLIELDRKETANPLAQSRYQD